jgi:hypothetical protein
MGDVIVVVVGVVLVVVTIVVLMRQGSPGRLSDENSRPGPRPDDEPRGEVVGRPGDAATEATGVAGPGESSPDPRRQTDEEGT